MWNIDAHKLGILLQEIALWWTLVKLLELTVRLLIWASTSLRPFKAFRHLKDWVFTGDGREVKIGRLAIDFNLGKRWRGVGLTPTGYRPRYLDEEKLTRSNAQKGISLALVWVMTFRLSWRTAKQVKEERHI